MFLCSQFLFVKKCFAQHQNTSSVPLKFHVQVLAEICEGKFSFLYGSLEGIIPFLILERRLYYRTT